MAVRLNNGDDINTRFDVDISKLKPEEEGFLSVANLKQDNVNVETYLSDTILEVTLAESSFARRAHLSSQWILKVRYL